MPKPNIKDCPAYLQNYIALVPEDDLMTAFSNQLPIIQKLLNGINEEKANYAYDTGKWTLKELLQHMIDTERIFNYRALCFSRKETVSLPGFDENDYATNSNANARSWQDLVNEFLAVRSSTEHLFKSFTPDMLAIAGTSNNNPATAAAIGFITIGHVYHHKNIIEERYL